MRSGTTGLAVIACLLASLAQADDKLWLPTGQMVTPLAAPGSTFQPLNVDLPTIGKAVAGGGVTTALTPDGRSLFLLTSGFNFWRDANGKEIKDASVEHLFVYDLSTASSPERTQDLPLPEAYGGLVISSDGKAAYVATGSDDGVRFFHSDSKGHWSEDGAALTFGHAAGNGLTKSPQVLKPMAAGAALTADSKVLLVANYENDSVDVINLETRKVTAELDLRPGKADPAQRGVPGGEFPYWIAIKGDDTAYVSSERDREIDVIALGPQPHVATRIPVQGNPNRLLLDRSQGRLFAATDNTDRVYVIDTATNKIVSSLAVGVPAGFGANARLPGAAPNSLALSPDERTLYVAEGGINAVGVVEVSGPPALIGLIPTAWQPNSVSVSAEGKFLYVANGKSPAGPDPHNCAKAQATTANCSAADQLGAANQYVWQHTTGGLQTIPVPDADTLKRLTAQVADNNGYSQVMSKGDVDLMAALRKRIKHVIYIVKENRTYDQILGDVRGADGDPALVQFGPDVTTNEHALAQQFVTLDGFFDSGEASGNGWQWSTAARTTDVTEKEMPVNYADRGLTYDFEGHSRGINVAIPIEQRRKANPVNDPDPDLLPGPANQAAPDGPDGEIEQGYVWDAALRAHKSVRNYGFFVDIVRYDTHVPETARIPVERDAYAKKLTVAIPSNGRLMNLTDPYFRGFDNKLPDLYRYREWNREFSSYEKKGRLPAFEMVRFMHDHTGNFKDAIDGVNTPDTQIADNDYAVGLLVDRIAHSKFAGSTLVFVIEDDAQDGPDHVDAHRSIAFVAGPYIRQRAVVSDRYTTVNVIRTMEEVLGLKPLNFHDANARPMTTVFDLKQAKWTYRAKVPAMLRSTQLPLPPAMRADAIPVRPLHDAAWWANATRGLDFSAEDRLKPADYNALLWRGTKGEKPYPKSRDGRNRRMAAR